jgi:hypothetical protein
LRKKVNEMKYALWICVFAQTLLAHDIITTNLTYTRDISRIMARHCSSCHGAQSAIPLTSYEEVRPWAVGIKEQVLSRAMPPWGAVKGFGNFKPDESLGQEDIMTIAAWVIGGAPKGDVALLPKTSKSTAYTPPAGPSISGETRLQLETSVRALAIRPVPDQPVESTRIVATLPNGRAEPLLWLYRFDPKWQRTFVFREPLDLPKGTVVASSAPLRFMLETR